MTGGSPNPEFKFAVSKRLGRGQIEPEAPTLNNRLKTRWFFSSYHDDFYNLNNSYVWIFPSLHVPFGDVPTPSLVPQVVRLLSQGSPKTRNQWFIRIKKSKPEPPPPTSDLAPLRSRSPAGKWCGPLHGNLPWLQIAVSITRRVVHSETLGTRLFLVSCQANFWTSPLLIGSTSLAFGARGWNLSFRAKNITL